MPILSIYVDDRTMERLEAVSQTSGRSVEDLAESAVAEEAMAAIRHDGRALAVLLWDRP